MDMNIQKLLAFITTVEHGSFTKAAKLLDYSQSGISRMISDLEKDWQVTLLVRGRAGVHLTSDGLRLLPYARKVYNEYTELQTQVDEISGLKSGLIRIGTFSSVATHWLPSIIREFQKEYPNIDYELLLGDYVEIEKWLLEGRVDCGFLRLPVRDHLETTFLEDDKLMVVLPVDHPFADRDKFPVKALGDYPFMLLEKDNPGDISELLEHLNVTPNIKFTTWDDYAILAMIENGLGISILPQLILRRIPNQVVIKELDVPAARKICIATSGEKTAPLAVTRFLEYLEYRHDESPEY
ncbi:LysR family transcriptional regulator [Ohessyouella blattaphilus]|uniref:LysR family transcriptional regulator n=1 Tax=Ohessyouella blattaphilus TaxID=2949333 RepID=A0ABT1EGS2_9FIRM|nr:LysR family transcriptional regulator [Ohessyouella blattaphilus]MCP1109904.1 LysR family transcriptional regulator [Ohessyouella blattaphilus]MCR8563298.1 LysR family transcriptional regulator [Ohessyouella blattaphilus]MDL2249546.1 LysR family transcriptional regulator [Lachnospiraceae bacterium OttesenSCG-928-J05]